MAQVKFHKFVAALPAELEADAIYYVRAGAGFDIYVTNSSGVVVAYPLNLGGPGQAFFRAEPITATAAGQTVFAVPGGYTPGAIIVSLNGATLPPADYTTADGATVTLGSGVGIVVGSVLLVYVLSAFEVADALPLLGTAYDSERFAGLLPPPEDGKQYALKDGAWVEVEAGGGSWGSITGALTDQTDLNAALGSKADSADIDFTIIYPNGGSAASPANVAVNSRYAMANPFPGRYVIAKAEILISGTWYETSWLFNGSTNNSGGVFAGQAGDDVVVQTGQQYILVGSSAQMGNPIGPAYPGITTSAPCRVLVWKVKGAIA